jgi:hypothetical protein
VRRFALEFVCIVPALILFRHQHLSEDFMAVYGTLELKKHHRRLIFAIRPAPKPTLGSHGPAVSVLSNEVADGCFDHPDFCLLTHLTSTRELQPCLSSSSVPTPRRIAGRLFSLIQLPLWARHINLSSACIFATVYETR